MRAGSASGLSLCVHCYNLRRKIRTLPFAFTFLMSDLCVHAANLSTSQASSNAIHLGTKTRGGGWGESTSSHWHFVVLLCYRISNELHLGSH